MLFQRKFGNCLAVLIYDGHAPVREIRSIHKHAIRPELAGDFPRAFAGGLHIREVELVFRKSGCIVGEFDFVFWHDPYPIQAG